MLAFQVVQLVLLSTYALCYAQQLTDSAGFMISASSRLFRRSLRPTSSTKRAPHRLSRCYLAITPRGGGAAMTAEEKPISQILWEDNLKEAQKSLHHPWVVGLGLGTLEKESFAQYIAQDAFFLESFAKAYAFALGKCSDREGIVAFHGLIGAVLDELKLHSGLAERWGVDLAALREPKQATDDYTGFLMATAQAADSTPADVLAAMAPCMRLYAHLGRTLRAAFPERLGRPGHPFAEWVDTYASDEFEAAARTVEDLLDK
ncbi:unnamed protein product [Heterosigma akashiwo]